jgi:hypothetical protein
MLCNKPSPCKPVRRVMWRISNQGQEYTELNFLIFMPSFVVQLFNFHGGNIKFYGAVGRYRVLQINILCLSLCKGLNCN